jgi:hypothetical protein
VLVAVGLSTPVGIIFQAINWLLFLLYPGTKGFLVGSKHCKTHIHNSPEYEASAHCLHITQLLTASCGIIVRRCIIYYSIGFPSGKEMVLMEMCNYEARSAIVWDLTQRRMATLTTIVLFDP